MSKMSVITHVLKKWKLYEMYKQELSIQQLEEYENIISSLNELNDDELKFMYQYFIVTAEIKPRKGLLNPIDEVHSHRVALMPQDEFMKSQNLTKYEFQKIKKSSYDKFQKKYYQYFLELSMTPDEIDHPIGTTIKEYKSLLKDKLQINTEFSSAYQQYKINKNKTQQDFLELVNLFVANTDINKRYIQTKLVLINQVGVIPDDKQRQAVRMVYIQDMQLDDVARVLRLPISEVRTLLQI